MHWIDFTRRQGGVVARSQLLDAGLTADSIDARVRHERFERTSVDAVYRAAGAPVTPETAAWFAVLSTRSPLSFVSAGQWWELPVEGDGLVHITRFDRRRLDWPDGVRVHRVALRATAVTHHRGLPVTTRVETLLDCLGSMKFGPAASLADRAVQQRWLTAEQVERRLVDQPGRWGNRQLRRLLPQLGDGAASAAERLLHDLLRAAGIGGWTPNVSITVGGRCVEIDVAFTGRRLAIEVDGRRYHSGDDRFQADRTKQNALIAAGWTVLRFTWADLTERPHEVLARITQLLAA